MITRRNALISGAAALAGTAYAKNGQLLAFALMADQISKSPGALGRAATAMVKVASVLAACGCR